MQVLKGLLSKQETANLHQQVKRYLIQIRAEERKKQLRQMPGRIDKKYHLLLTIFFTIILTIINFDELFSHKLQSKKLAQLQNINQIQRKVQYVFEQTVIKYTIIYPMRVSKCESMFPIMPESWCSEKSARVNSKLVYSIGYRPNLQKLAYDYQNNTISGEWSPLQILGYSHDRQIIEEQATFFNSWSLLEFQTKYKHKLQALDVYVKPRINQYIQNITQNQTSVSKLENNIKNALMKLVSGEQSSGKSLTQRALGMINRCFDKVLIFLSLDPFLSQQKKDNPFSPEMATEYFKQDIFSKDQFGINQISLSDINDSVQPAQQKHQTVKNNDNLQQKPSQPQKYNSEDMRQKYNKLQRKLNKI